MKIPAFVLIHDVEIKSYLGVGAYGNSYTDTPIKTKMRVDPKQKMVRDAQGREIVSSAFMIADPETEVKTNDIIIYNNREYVVESVTPFDTDVGTHHLELVVK